jgi:hypothetical protein
VVAMVLIMARPTIHTRTGTAVVGAVAGVTGMAVGAVVGVAAVGVVAVGVVAVGMVVTVAGTGNR